MFLSSKLTTVCHYSSIGTVARFPLTMFQLLTMTLLPLSIRNPAICGEHWIMIANSRQIVYLADSLGRKKNSFLKQQYELMIAEAQQSHPSVWVSYTIYAPFHLSKFRREKITGVHDVNVLSFISNYM